MNRKKALYRYEFGNMKWFLVAGLVCCGLLLLFLNKDFHGCQNSAWEISTSFNQQLLGPLGVATVLAIFAVAVMTVFQFSDYHKRNKREYISSLPYTQKERFVAKYLVGGGIVSVVWLIFGAGVLLLREKYFMFFLKNDLTSPVYKVTWGNDMTYQTVRWLLLLWLILMTVYSVFTLVHSVVTHGVVAFVVGIGALYTPAVLMYEIMFYYQMFQQKNLKLPPFVEAVWQGLQAPLGDSYRLKDYTMEDYAAYIDYGSMPVVFGILALIFLVCVVASYLVNIRQDSAKYGVLVVKKWARIAISAGVAVGGSFLLIALFGTITYVVSGEETTSPQGIAYCWLAVQLVLMAAIYWLMMRLTRRTTK